MVMERENWGTKRVCLNCGTRFYDFDKTPIVCPSCGTTFDPEYIYKKRTKLQQEKIDDDQIDVDINDEMLSDDENIVSIDESEDVLEQEK